MKMSEAFDIYLTKTDVYKAKGTYDKTFRKINQLRKFFSDYEVDEVDELALLQYVKMRKQDSRKPKNVTINMELGTLSRVIKYVAKRPFHYEKLPEVMTLKKELDDYVIDKVFNYLIRHMHEYPEFLRNYVLFSLLLDTGIRISEALGLTLDDIEFTSNTIHLKRTKTDRERYVFFTDRTKENMLRLITTHRLSDRLFVSYKKDQPLKVDNVQAFCYRMEKKLDLPYTVRPHKWRHTFATKFLKKGGDLETLRLIMGHTSLKTTQLYLHFNKDHLHEEYFRINQ